MNNIVGTLPSARMSPRIINGALKWYEGDTFNLQVEIDLTDENGDKVEMVAPQTVEFRFHNKRDVLVWAVTFENIENNTVVLNFNKEVTGKFPKGEYNYNVIYNGAYRKTLARMAPVYVE